MAVDELIKCLVDVRDLAKQQAGVYHLHTIVFDGLCVCIWYTGLDGDTPDGGLGDVVHAAISTLHNAAGSVLGGLQQCGLFEKVGGGTGPGQSAGIGDVERAGGSNFCV